MTGTIQQTVSALSKSPCHSASGMRYAARGSDRSSTIAVWSSQNGAVRSHCLPPPRYRSARPLLSRQTSVSSETFHLSLIIFKIKKTLLLCSYILCGLFSCSYGGLVFMCRNWLFASLSTGEASNVGRAFVDSALLSLHPP